MAANRPVHAAAPSKLRADHRLIPHLFQGFAYDAFVVPNAGKTGTVYLRCIKEGAAMLKGVLNGLDAVLLIGACP